MRLFVCKNSWNACNDCNDRRREEAAGFPWRSFTFTTHKIPVKRRIGFGRTKPSYPYH